LFYFTFILVLLQLCGPLKGDIGRYQRHHSSNDLIRRALLTAADIFTAKQPSEGSRPHGLD